MYVVATVKAQELLRALLHNDTAFLYEIQHCVMRKAREHAPRTACNSMELMGIATVSRRVRRHANIMTVPRSSESPV